MYVKEKNLQQFLKNVVLVLRRSKRNRKLAYESMSWLHDNQMPTAGYPNPKLVSTEYSEEDSRDAQV